ncbi:ARM repeat-containing protein [Sporormia fimetaria CBS 119925]|uniref:ARM repeat-containing protein n=1 Tax=Sporormia fimetaria CBS 119925 TaxID=1340428 RepID=A0A6A6UVK1_9PLEO|nr:ARM repeat-containing protein [Sporormia fimetaria CBS 119925]
MSLNITSDGSPTPRKTVGRFNMADDLANKTPPEVLGAVGSRQPPQVPQQLWPSSLTFHAQGVKRPLTLSSRNTPVSVQGTTPMSTDPTSIDGYKKLKIDNGAHQAGSVMDTLLQHIEQATSPHNTGSSNTGSNATSKEYENSSNNSVPITPATDEFADSVVVIPAAELQRLKAELQEKTDEVARTQQELHTTHQLKSTFEHAVGQSTDTDYYYKGEVTEQAISQLQNRFNASTRPMFGRQDTWPLPDDEVSEKGEVKPFGQAIWNNGNRQYHNGWGAGMNTQGFGSLQSRPSSGHPGYRRNGYLNEPTHFPLDSTFRGGLVSNPPSRPNSAFEPPRYGQYPGYNGGLVPTGNVSPTMPHMSMQGPLNVYAPVNGIPPYTRPIGTMGTRLSPEAAEFNVDVVAPTPWNSQVRAGEGDMLAGAMANLRVAQPSSESGHHYMAPAEPMNYRRLLDRNMNCNWKYIVDKIICNNDQQASIFLQQKLKVGTTEQKYEIVEAIIAQAYALMINRFGNFLVQRCFEHGTPEQVIAIAQAIRGNTLNLSMDAFGCHVVQKAFDAVPEEYKATMVHELLRRIPETVIHRYACHVWQKLFELRWSDSPPQIMRYVNEALRGMWHEVALGETGSLVVQNIFENCLEEDKRPCINEVLASIDTIARGQFGNWCIQHICEHGAPADRNRAIEHILHLATEYSMDQYASKVIEKCLKIGGPEFLDRYLERICEARPDRPRMPLIDIAGDQFGNYLIQYILTNSTPHHRDVVASHVRKHMVSLRGSKYGSRVAMLCCNPALATRPGPPAGMQLNRYTTHGVQRGSGYGSGFR